MFAKIKQFMVEVGGEMNKVSWPIKKGQNLTLAERYQELYDSTTMVIFSSLALAIYIGLVDMGLSALIKILVG
jgi:preprotein translocase subunit SecE